MIIARLFALLSLLAPPSHAEETPKASGGIAFQADYGDFRLIAVSQRSDDQTLRAILGNDIAVAAARAGKTNPWPDGAILAKLAWQQRQSQAFPTATVPGAFSSVAFMVKDAKKYPSTGGWGWGEWAGQELTAYEKPGFAQECAACHAKAKDADWVFTHPAPLP